MCPRAPVPTLAWAGRYFEEILRNAVGRYEVGPRCPQGIDEVGLGQEMRGMVGRIDLRPVSDLVKPLRHIYA